MPAFTELDNLSGDGLAGVYYPAVVEAATPDHPETSAILGATIVHEVGPPDPGRESPLQPRCDERTLGAGVILALSAGELNFTAEQARKFRETLSGRGGEVQRTAQR